MDLVVTKYCAQNNISSFENGENINAYVLVNLSIYL